MKTYSQKINKSNHTGLLVTPWQKGLKYDNAYKLTL